MNVEDLKAKYCCDKRQNDAADTLAARLDAASKLKVSAQKALDALFAASRKASAAVSAYNKAIARGGIDANKVGKMVDFHDVLNNLKSGANTRI